VSSDATNSDSAQVIYGSSEKPIFVKAKVRYFICASGNLKSSHFLVFLLSGSN